MSRRKRVAGGAAFRGLYVAAGLLFGIALIGFIGKGAENTKMPKKPAGNPISTKVVNAGGSVYHVEKYADGSTVVTWMYNNNPAIMLTYSKEKLEDVTVVPGTPLSTEYTKQMLTKMITDLWVNHALFEIPREVLDAPAGLPYNP